MRNTVRGVVLAAAIVLGLSPLGFAPAVAFGQTVWHVDDDACPGPGSGSEVDPFCKIQDALNSAALAGDEIIVSPGTYHELINFIGKAVHLHSFDGAEVTTIDGTGLDGSVVSCITGEGPDTILEGFTIIGGTGTWCVIDSDLYCGGGMYMVDASPTVSDCTFINNSANSGGGVYISGMSPSITDCTFTNNSALLAEYWFEEHGGGGVFVFQSSPIISDCTFTQNTSETDGGGIRNIESLTIVRNCSFSNNTADVDGGGIDNYDGQYPYIPITVEDCTFDSNVAGASGGFAEGGGVNSQGSITVSGCTFNDNSASHEGGGLATEFGDVNISSCTFTNNDSIAGGGVFTFQGRVQIESCSFISNTTTWIGGGMADIGSDAIITNCLFQSNKSHQGGGLYQEQTSTVITSCVFNGNISTPGVNRSGDGGAIYIHDYYLTLINCSITGNRAESGGGIYAYSDFAIINSTISNNVALVDGGGVFHLPRGEISTFTNTILFDNSAGGIVVDSNPYYPTPHNISYSNIQGSGGSDHWDDSFGTNGSGNIDVDPMFVRNPDDGGDGWGDDPLTLEVDEGANDDFGDIHLQPDSPCINRANNDAIPIDVTTDFEGNDRIQYCRADMGADETPYSGSDCNSNGVSDGCDVENATSYDCNENNIPDECEADDDCNENSNYDFCDLYSGASNDCNDNKVPDECETIHTIVYVDDDALPGGDGWSWDSAYNNLQDALRVADCDLVTEVRVASGTYTPGVSPFDTFRLISGVRLSGGYSGYRSDQPNARNIEFYPTILSGDIGKLGDMSDNIKRIIFSVDIDASAILDGFIIKDGSNGSAMFNLGGSPTIMNCTFTRNYSTGNGGCLTNYGGSPTFSNCDFVENMCRSKGGCIYTDNSADIKLFNCAFINNSAYSGNTGGVSGGAIYNAGSKMKLVNCFFFGNSCKFFGGAIYNRSSSITEVVRCAFYANIAQAGGAIYNRSSGDRMLISDNLFVGNSATEPGGAIYNLSGKPLISQSTFSGNTSDLNEGNSIANFNRSDLTLTHNIFSDTGTWIYNDANSFSTISFSHLSNGDLSGSIDGGGNLIGDPIFVRNPDNGGDGWGDDPLTLEIDEGANDDFGDLRLQSGSPCINAGDPIFVAEVDASDLDGHPRVLCDVVDMGAYEFGIGDYDCDQAINMFDFSAWESCFTDPNGGPYEAGCEAFDFNADGDVDLQDFAGFQLFYSGM